MKKTHKIEFCDIQERLEPGHDRYYVARACCGCGFKSGGLLISYDRPGHTDLGAQLFTADHDKWVQEHL